MRIVICGNGWKHNEEWMGWKPWTRAGRVIVPIGIGRFYGTLVGNRRAKDSLARYGRLLDHIRSEENPADILSKHWDCASVWNQLRPVLFWTLDTADIAHLSGPREVGQAPKQT